MTDSGETNENGGWITKQLPHWLFVTTKAKKPFNAN